MAMPVSCLLNGILRNLMCCFLGKNALWAGIAIGLCYSSNPWYF